MRRKVLVTGAGGFIGRNLINELSATNWEIIPLVRKNIGFKNEVIIDFCDSIFCQKINSSPKVDAVIHLGARVDFGDNLRRELFVPNVLATAELVQLAAKRKIFFLFASTATICGARNPHITSSSKRNPDSDYAYSKWLAEEIIKMSGVKYSILRIGGVFGMNGPEHLGINKSIKRGLKALKPIQYGKGTQKRNYIYVKDMVNVIEYCLKNEIEGTHLVSGSSVNTVSEMLNIISDVLISGDGPEYRSGKDGLSQIVVHSGYLPK